MRTDGCDQQGNGEDEGTEKNTHAFNEASMKEKSVIVITGLVAIFAIYLHIVLFYPGSMSVDSQDQYGQALAGIYKDWHPPVMAFVWRMVNRVWTGPPGMLTLHLLTFWSALFLFWKYLAKKNVWLALWVPVIALCPTVIGMVGVIWKDIGAAVCALVAAGIFLGAAKKKKYQIAIAFIAIFYATAVRRNGLFLVAPILWLAIDDLLRPHLRGSRQYRLVASAMLTLITSWVLLSSISFFEQHVLKTTPQHLEQTIFLHDLAMMSEDTGTDKTPVDFHTAHYSAKALQEALVDRRCVDSCIFGEKAVYDVMTVPKAKALYDLKQSWLATIADSPISYLQHRFTLWKSLVGWGFPSCRIEHFYFDQRFNRQLPAATYWQAIAHSFICWTDQHTPFMKAWPWLVLALLSLIIIERTGEHTLHRKSVVPLAALCYAGGYFPSTVCCDFRYVWVIPILAMLSLLLAVDSLLDKFHKAH